MKTTISFLLSTILLVGCGGGAEEGSSQPWLGDKSPSTPVTPPSNTAPEISGLPQQLNLVYGTKFNVQLSISDAQGDAMQVSLKEAPKWALISQDANSKNHSLSGVPAEIGAFSGIVEVSDGKAVTKEKITFLVSKPDVVSVEFIAPDGVGNDDTLSFVDANSAEPYVVARYDATKDLFVAKFPLKASAFSGADLVLTWQKPDGFAPYIRWIGLGSELIEKMDTKLMLPSGSWRQWLPDAKSTAYMHILTQYGALDSDAKIREWTSIATHAVRASNLREIAMYYAMSRDIPELHPINKLMQDDLKIRYLHPQEKRLLSAKVNDARLKVNSLVSEQYWKALKNKYQSEAFGTDAEWSQKKMAIVYPSGLRQSASNGFVFQRKEEGLCLLNGAPLTCTTKNSEVQLSGVRIDAKEVPVEHLQSWLMLRGVSKEDALRAVAAAGSVGETSLNISEDLRTMKIVALLWTPDQRGVLEATVTGSIQLHSQQQMLMQIEMNEARREMIALPDTTSHPRHWVAKSNIFDLVVPFPQGVYGAELRTTWLDLFSSPDIQVLDAAASATSKRRVFSLSDWSAMTQPTETKMTFHRNGSEPRLRYQLTLIDESAPNFDHEEDIQGRQYSFIAELFEGDTLLSTSVQTGILHPKARCEVSPLRENACLPASKVGLQGTDPAKGFWADVVLGEAWGPEESGKGSIFQLRRVDAAPGQQLDATRLRLIEKEIGLCEPLKIDTCPVKKEWMIQASAATPGVWLLSAQGGGVQNEKMWLVLNRNVGDLVVYDVQSQTIRHFEYFEQQPVK